MRDLDMRGVLSQEQLFETVRLDLIDSFNGECYDDSLRDNLSSVIKYYSTPAQWIEFCNNVGSGAVSST